MYLVWYRGYRRKATAAVFYRCHRSCPFPSVSRERERERRELVVDAAGTMAVYEGKSLVKVILRAWSNSVGF